jgi:osmotically-inducible protein OsmY
VANALKGGACAALVASLALVVACSSAPPKSPQQERADAATAERIYAALDAAPMFYFRDVEVSVDNGVAVLSGYVWTTDALYHAKWITRQVPGVTRVVTNRLELEREGNRAGGDGSSG